MVDCWIEYLDSKYMLKYLVSSVFSVSVQLLFLTRQNWSEGNGQLFQCNLYQYTYIDFLASYNLHGIWNGQ